MTTNRAKFLDLIAWSEGTSTSRITLNNGYDVIVSGTDGAERFDDYSKHPFSPPRKAKLVRPGLYSTAAGRYQVLYRYWVAYRDLLKLPDFSPVSQDLIALQQIRERKALPLIDAGDIPAAINLCSGLWASLPGNGYGQGGHELSALMSQWNSTGLETV